MDQTKRTLKPPIKISILEKEESEVSYCWKACQLFSYILVVISGIATTLAIGSLLRTFQNQCILYSEVAVQSVNNKTISVKLSGSTMSYCNFCQFCPVASVIFAGIWGTLFVMCGRGGNANQNLPQPWRIVPPAFLFNLVFVIISSVSVALTFGGFTSFCDGIIKDEKVNETSCEALMDYKFVEPNVTNFYDDIVIAETGSAISLVGWLLGFVILVIRCLSHADFTVKQVDSSPSPSETTSTITTTAGTTAPLTPPGKTRNEQEPLIILTPSTGGSGPGPFRKSQKKMANP